MNIRVLWLTFWLLVLSAVAIPRLLHAQQVTIAVCNEDCDCRIREEVLDKIIQAVEFWHDQAKSCKAV